MASIIFGDFEWDGAKAEANVRKHGVSFEEASTIFADHSYILRADRTAPDRFHAIGMSASAHVLTVVHLERARRIRIISARKATRHERQTYASRRQT